MTGGDEAAIQTGLGRIKAQHPNRRAVAQTVEQAPDRRGRHERAVAIQDNKVAFETRKRFLGAPHSMTSSHRRILIGKRVGSQQRANMIDQNRLRWVCNNNDPVASDVSGKRY